MENALIRILPVCLVDDLPAGWDASAPGYVVEVAPEVGAPEEVPNALLMAEPDVLLLDADVPNFESGTSLDPRVVNTFLTAMGRTL